MLRIQRYSESGAPNSPFAIVCSLLSPLLLLPNIPPIRARAALLSNFPAHIWNKRRSRTGSLCYEASLHHSGTVARLSESNLRWSHIGVSEVNFIKGDAAHLIYDRVLLYHRTALNAKPVSRGGIVLDDRPSTICTARLVQKSDHCASTCSCWSSPS